MLKLYCHIVRQTLRKFRVPKRGHKINLCLAYDLLDLHLNFLACNFSRPCLACTPARQYSLSNSPIAF